MKLVAWSLAGFGLAFAAYGAFIAGIAGDGYAIFGVALVGVARMVQASPD